MGHLVQQSVAARLEGFERLTGCAPASFVVFLGVESILRQSGGEEYGADLHLGIRPIVCTWLGVGDGETGLGQSDAF